MRIFRVDPFTGSRHLHKELPLADPAGALYGSIVLTPDGSTRPIACGRG